VIKDHVNNLNERLEEALYQRDSYKIELDQLQQKYNLKVKDVESQKRQIM
jgi:uncharacterized membrane protein YgaE (UPF0421/DUF939 family)